MKKIFKISILLVVLSIVTVMIIKCSKKESSIQVGRILPLTGPAASYGKSEQKGTLLALEEINSAGGIGDRTLEILFEDSQCLVKEGTNAMKKLVDIDKVPAVLGATCSGVTLAIAPIANEREVLLLSPLSSASAITNAGPFVFRVMPSDAFQSRILAEWMFLEGHKKIAMLYINNAWGIGVSDEFKRAFEKLGGTIVVTEVCKEGDRDFRVQLTKIRDSNPSAIFCPTMPKEGGIILKQIKEFSIKLPVYGGDAWSVQELIDGGGDATNGVMYTYPAQFVGEEYQTFSRAFRAKYSEEPDVNAAGAYDALKILAICMGKVIEKGFALTGENIRQEMMNIKDYKGATGMTTFNEDGDSIAKTFEKMIIQRGERIKYVD